MFTVFVLFIVTGRLRHPEVTWLFCSSSASPAVTAPLTRGAYCLHHPLSLRLDEQEGHGGIPAHTGGARRKTNKGERGGVHREPALCEHFSQLL